MQNTTLQASPTAAQITKRFDYSTTERATELIFFDSDTDTTNGGTLIVERNTENINGEKNQPNYYITLQRCTGGVIEHETRTRVTPTQLNDFAAFFADIVQRLNA